MQSHLVEMLIQKVHSIMEEIHEIPGTRHTVGGQLFAKHRNIKNNAVATRPVSLKYNGKITQNSKGDPAFQASHVLSLASRIAQYGGAPKNKNGNWIVTSKHMDLAHATLAHASGYTVSNIPEAELTRAHSILAKHYNDVVFGKPADDAVYANAKPKYSKAG